MGVTIDAGLVIDAFDSLPRALRKLEEIDQRSEAKVLTTPVLYEILSGIRFTRSKAEAAAFRNLASAFQIVPVDEAAAEASAELRTELMRMGEPRPAVDIFLAGIALSGGHSIVSNDVHFETISKVSGLRVENY